MSQSAQVLHVLLRTLVLPPAAPLLLMLLGWLLARRLRAVGHALVALGAVALWLLSTPLLSYRLLHAVEPYPPLELAQARSAQAIVVLGAGSRLGAPEYGRDAPDDDTLQRIVYAATLAKRTGLPLLVSGGSFDLNSAVADVMQVFLQNPLGVPVRWIEPDSFDTRENALYSAAILRREHIQRIVLVTSASHLPRAAAEFRHAGLEVVPAPADIATRGYNGILNLVPSADALRDSHAALYEWLGEAVRRWQEGS
jgi:uncharacterized SAM-binding protein YcdF (DUF218 family)